MDNGIYSACQINSRDFPTERKVTSYLPSYKIPTIGGKEGKVTRIEASGRYFVKFHIFRNDLSASGLRGAEKHVSTSGQLEGVVLVYVTDCFTLYIFIRLYCSFWECL